MGSFDENLDVEVVSYVSEDTGLIVAVKQYNGGVCKLQIGPRVYEKKDGSESFRKAGRLDLDDVLFLEDVLPEMKEVLTECFLESSQPEPEPEPEKPQVRRRKKDTVTKKAASKAAAKKTARTLNKRKK